MELKEVIEKRASVRNFSDEPISIETLKEIVRLAGLAPSINNSQPWKFIVITRKEMLKEMAEIVRNKIDEVILEGEGADKVKAAVNKFSTFFATAPAVIAVLSEPYEAVIDKVLDKTNYNHDDMNEIRNYPNVQSIGAAIQNLLLAAVDSGYSGCWLSGLMIAKNELEDLLNVKSPFNLSACVVIGKSAEEVKQREKKTLNEILEVIE